MTTQDILSATTDAIINNSNIEANRDEAVLFDNLDSVDLKNNALIIKTNNGQRFALTCIDIS